MRNLLLGAFLVLAVIIGIAFWQDWAGLSVRRDDGGTVREVAVQVDPERARADVDSAAKGVQSAVRETGERFREGIKRIQSGEQSMKGALQSVDATRGTVTILPEGGTAMSMELTDQTRIRIGDKQGTRDDLKAGQSVTASYETVEGKNLCRSITVELNK